MAEHPTAGDVVRVGLDISDNIVAIIGIRDVEDTERRFVGGDIVTVQDVLNVEAELLDGRHRGQNNNRGILADMITGGILRQPEVEKQIEEQIAEEMDANGYAVNVTLSL